MAADFGFPVENVFPLPPADFQCYLVAKFPPCDETCAKKLIAWARFLDLSWSTLFDVLSSSKLSCPLCVCFAGPKPPNLGYVHLLKHITFTCWFQRESKTSQNMCVFSAGLKQMEACWHLSVWRKAPPPRRSEERLLFHAVGISSLKPFEVLKPVQGPPEGKPLQHLPRLDGFGAARGPFLLEGNISGGNVLHPVRSNEDGPPVLPDSPPRIRRGLGRPGPVQRGRLRLPSWAPRFAVGWEERGPAARSPSNWRPF